MGDDTIWEDAMDVGTHDDNSPNQAEGGAMNTTGLDSMPITPRPEFATIHPQHHNDSPIQASEEVIDTSIDSTAIASTQQI